MLSVEIEQVSLFLRAREPVADFSHEFEFVRWLRERCAPRKDVLLGIGDDAAIVEFGPDRKSAICTDTLMEGVHFTLETATPRQVGRKALAVNLSDIAAMGGVPKIALVSVCVPKGASAILKELYEGLLELAEEFHVAIVGGDTNTWDGPLVISVTVMGVMEKNEPVKRSGAKPGDWILVTGSLGGSLSGNHLEFTPRIAEAQSILKISTVNAMIDISDGLVADLDHILEESKVGAELMADRIPIDDAARNFSDERSPLDHAFYDGEDFELLFTTIPSEAEKLLANWKSDVPITHIGHIVENEGTQLRNPDDTSEPLSAKGWKHEF